MKESSEDRAPEKGASHSSKRAKSGKGQRWAGKIVRAGERASVSLQVSENYLGISIPIPMHVWRAPNPGPTLLVSAAVHGDEINGTGAIRELIRNPGFELKTGTLVLAPVINVPGFERHSRYLPDRRDLNRSFPGSRGGSMASRLAKAVFEKIIKKCDYCLDLHTASVRRTNFPNVRGDLSEPGVRRLARAFGCEVVIDNTGPEGSLRSEATAVGCSTLILEAGEVWKVEPSVVEYTLRGIRNILIDLEMIDGEIDKAPFRTVVRQTTWLRSSNGGFLQFHVRPGELVEEGQSLATNSDLLGTDLEVITAPQSGMVLGMTTIPSVSPGDPIVHLALTEPDQQSRIERGLDRLDDESLGSRIRSDLASNVHTTVADDDDRRATEDPDEL